LIWISMSLNSMRNKVWFKKFYFYCCLRWGHRAYEHHHEKLWMISNRPKEMLLIIHRYLKEQSGLVYFDHQCQAIFQQIKIQLYKTEVRTNVLKDCKITWANLDGLAKIIVSFPWRTPRKWNW
jgi:hypothetical protein